MGRKATGRTTRNITVSIPIELWDYIESIERASGLSKSRYVTMALKDFKGASRLMNYWEEWFKEEDCL